MKPSTAPTGLPQYPDLESRVQDLAMATVDGALDETEARNEILVAVYSCNLAHSVVRNWLSDSQLHLVDDLVFQAEAWLVRAITGRVIGENMVDAGKPGATLLNLERIGHGASAVGYLRKGLRMEMRKFMRTLGRRTGLGTGQHLIDTRVLSGVVDEQTATALDHYASAQVRSDSRDLLTEGDDMLAELAHCQYLENTRGQSTSARTVFRGQALQAYYQVPPAARPLNSASRQAMLKAITGDLSAAYRAMRSRLRDEHDAPRGLGQLWEHYTTADIESVLDSPRAVATAHTLALATLSPRPRVPIAVQRKFRVHTSRLFREAGLNASQGTALAKSFLDEEHEQSEPGHGTAPWSALAQDLIDHTPDLLGATLKQVRDGLTSVLGSCFEQ